VKSSEQDAGIPRLQMGYIILSRESVDTAGYVATCSNLPLAEMSASIDCVIGGRPSCKSATLARLGLFRCDIQDLVVRPLAPDVSPKTAIAGLEVVDIESVHAGGKLKRQRALMFPACQPSWSVTGYRTRFPRAIICEQNRGLATPVTIPKKE
jgi:hypothetical protein